MRLRRIAIGLAAFVVVSGVLAVVLRWWVKRRMGPPPAPIVVVLPEVPEDNGYDDFVSAARMYVKGADLRIEAGVPIPPEQRKTLDDNAGALAELRHGLAKPCVVPPKIDPEALSSECAAFRELARLLVIESRLASDAGGLDEALPPLLDGLRFGVKLEVGSAFLLRLVSHAGQWIVLSELQGVLASGELGEEELLAAAECLRDVQRASSPIAETIEAQHRMDLARVQMLAADPKAFAQCVKALLGKTIPPTQIDADEVGQMLTQHHNQLLEAAQQPYSAIKGRSFQPRQRIVPSPEDLAFEVLSLSYDKFFQKHFTLRSTRRGTQLLAAVELYRLRHGQPPRSLADLQSLKVPGIELPTTDPLTDKPFIYRPANGDYWLYSAGLDLDDDGGAEMNWQTREGDLVFHAPGDPVGERHQGDQQ